MCIRDRRDREHKKGWKNRKDSTFRWYIYSRVYYSCLLYTSDQIRDEIGKPKHEYESCAIPEQMFEDIKKIVTPEQMEEAVFTDEKQKREENIRAITEQLEEAFADNEE